MRRTAPDRDGAFLGNGQDGSDDVTDDDGPIDFGAEPPSEEEVIRLSQVTWSSYTTYMDMTLRQSWEDGLNLFHSRHIENSRYLSDDYRNRSKLFRPKTRSAVRRAEAAVTSAFFSTQDQVSLQPMNEEHPQGRASAEFWTEVLNYRLDKTIKWFQTCVGSFQVAQIQGACFTKQFWRYELEPIGNRPVYDKHPTTGADIPVLEENSTTGQMEQKTETVWVAVCDEPAISMHRPECVRIDPAADWRDPINTTPCLIIEHIMTVGEVKRRGRLRDGKTGEPIWRDATDGALRQAQIHMADSTATTRTGAEVSQDPNTIDRSVFEHQRVSVREYFQQWDGVDWHWFILGGVFLLCGIAPTIVRYPHLKRGERPLAMGVINQEAFNVFPTAKVNLTAPLQHEANAVSNLRIDGINLTLQPRTKVVAGRLLNPEAIHRVDPSQPLMVKSADDVTWDKAPDVGASAFQEEDRLNVEFDDMAGNFSQASVMTNKDMNETVGGMQMLSGAAGSMGEYDMKVFAETWVVPTLDQVMRLCQMYETDEVVMALASQAAKLAAKYGIDEITDDLLTQGLLLSVNVGIGSTDPQQQMQRFAMGWGTLGMIAKPIVEAFGPAVIYSKGMKEIAKEIFGKLGYKDVDRFMDFGEPPQPQGDPAAETKLKTEQMRGQTTLQVTDMKEKGALNREIIKAKSSELAGIRDASHDSFERHRDRLATFVNSERDRAHQSDQNDVDRQVSDRSAGLDRQHAAGMAESDRQFQSREAGVDRQHQAAQADADRQASERAAAAKAAATGGAGGGSPRPAPAPAAPKGPANPPGMTPLAAQGAQPGAGQGGEVVQFPRRLMQGQEQQRQQLEQVAAAVQDIQAGMKQFARMVSATLDNIENDLQRMGHVVGGMHERSQAKKSITMRDGKRFFKVGDQEREIQTGPDGSISLAD